MSANVEYTDEFGNWFLTLEETQQNDIASVVALLEELGTRLGFPHSSKINGSKALCKNKLYKFNLKLLA